MSPPSDVDRAPNQKPESKQAATRSVSVPSSVLLQGKKSVAIEHQGETYRLQVTKLGKLILTK